MKVLQSRADFFAARAELASPVGLVPTMGALHDGHAALLRAAREECAAVVTTNFVNPLQFGPSEDLARYPRSLDADLEVCAAAGVDVVWAPTVADVYPTGAAEVSIAPGPLGAMLEGETRPTHFAGMLTVVAKFFNLVRPGRAYFGEKDYQQLTLIRRMVADLDLGVAIVAVPTVRESDGLAMSSRNAYLSAAERQQALALSRALFAGREAAASMGNAAASRAAESNSGAAAESNSGAAAESNSGAAAESNSGAAAAITTATAVLAAEQGVKVDYLELRAADLGEIPEHGPARLLVAARVGATRLIDNVAVQL